MMDFNKFLFSVAFASLFLFLSCSEKQAKETVGSLPSIFPDYVGVNVPQNIAPLNFGVENASHLRAVITLANNELITIDGEDRILFSASQWQQVVHASKGGFFTVNLSVWSDQHPDGATYKPFKVYVDNDSIDAYVMYRLIPPGYEGWRYMGIYQRNMSSFDVQPIVENSQNNYGCVNCHSVANYSPSHFMFHGRGQGGGTVISTPKGLEKVNIEKMGPQKSGSYNAWHPSGRFIAFSSNYTCQSFYAHSRDKIEVYDDGSDLIVYDVDNHKVLADERFNDSIQWETFPAFSPDGKYLYFSVAPRVKMPFEYAKLHYSIIRVPFMEDGSLGVADTVYSASRMGGSALMPSISPDGRYMLFTWAESGAFHVYHKESCFKMLNLSTNEYVNVDALNSNDSESYHSWSSNGRWVMFSSKREDSRYTRIFLSHWDGKKFSKPFVLPQENPFANVQMLYSYNLPEFLKGPVELDKDEVSKLFNN